MQVITAEGLSKRLTEVEKEDAIDRKEVGCGRFFAAPFSLKLI